MNRRPLSFGFAAVGALVCVVLLATTAGAQPAPVQVVQGSDGTLYLMQGGKNWTLVPIQISDDQVAALDLSGEVNGTIPADLFSVPAPPPSAAAPEPPAAPAPAAPPAPQPPAQAAPAAAPITGTADVAGMAGSDVASATSIAVGSMIWSNVDQTTKPHDVFSIALSAGTAYQLLPNSTNHYGNAGTVTAFVLSPDASTAVQWKLGSNCGGCGSSGFIDDKCFPNVCSFTALASGTYFLQVDASGNDQRYGFTFKLR